MSDALLQAVRDNNSGGFLHWLHIYTKKKIDSPAGLTALEMVMRGFEEAISLKRVTLLENFLEMPKPGIGSRIACWLGLRPYLIEEEPYSSRVLISLLKSNHYDLVQHVLDWRPSGLRGLWHRWFDTPRILRQQADRNVGYTIHHAMLYCADTDLDSLCERKWLTTDKTVVDIIKARGMLFSKQMLYALILQQQSEDKINFFLNLIESSLTTDDLNELIKYATRQNNQTALDLLKKCHFLREVNPALDCILKETKSIEAATKVNFESSTLEELQAIDTNLDSQEQALKQLLNSLRNAASSGSFPDSFFSEKPDVLDSEPVESSQLDINITP